MSDPADRVGPQDRLRCLFRGHTKTWQPGFLGPTWRCTRCGATGGLEEHSQMPLGQHLIHAAVTAVALGGLWMVLRWIF